MAGIGGRCGGLAGLLAVAVALTGVAHPAPVAGADDPTFVLPGITLTALTADLDGDGEGEILRVVREPGVDPRSVNVWTHDGDGWSEVGSAPLPLATDDDGGITQSTNAAVALLLWRDAGRDRVLALSAAVIPNDPIGGTCCLTVSEVRTTPGGRVDVSSPQRIGGGAQSYQAVDVDGDGTQELVLHESRIGPGPGDEEATVTVMRWSGTTFEPIFEMTDPRLLFGFVFAESDGVTGDDLLFGPSADGMIHRLAWTDGELRSSETHVDTGERWEGWIAGVADGAIVISLGEELRVMRWRRGEEPVVVGRLRTLTFPGISVIGDGADALIATQDGFGFERGRLPTLTLHDLRLQRLGEVGVSPGTEGIWQMLNGVSSGGYGTLQRDIFPYSGPIPGAVVDGRAAFVSNGMLVQPGGPGGYESRPIASLSGVQPIGVAGPDDAWVVLGDGFGGRIGSAYLSFGEIYGAGRLTVTLLEHLLLPDDEVESASVKLVDAVELVGDDGESRLMAEGEGFEVVVSAPRGSAVIVANGPIGPDLEEREVADGPVTVGIQPGTSRRDDTDIDFEAFVLVLTPDGRSVTRQWTGTFVREPPELRVSAATDTMALSATLEGRASPGSQVTAGSQTIEVDADGRFVATIDAPIWPSQVLVAARDPLGNEATERVEVLGVVDYRGLPWAAILILATLVVGGVLYVRAPKRRMVASTADGDGRLEEIELGTIDLVEPRGR